MSIIQRSASLFFRFMLHPVALAVSGLAFLVAVRFFDTRFAYIPYVTAVTLAIAALIFLFTRRPYLSLYAAGALTLLQAAISMMKYQLNGLALHFYDLFFMVGDKSLLAFLGKFYPGLLTIAGLVVMSTIALLALMYRYDRPLKWRVPFRMAAVGLSVVLAFAAFPRTKTHDSDYLPFTAGYNAAALYFSFKHVPYLLQASPLANRLADTVSVGQFADSVNCGMVKDRSDLFLVLAESQASPFVYPGASLPDRTVATFNSGDSHLRSLNVETFGAGTWMTNFSVLTGLSTADLGWQAPYVNKFFERKVRGSLPDVLRRCGYRTIALMSLRYHALNEGPFLKSIGFDEVYGSEQTGLEAHGTRDRDFFALVDRIVADHREKDGRPLFIAMQTMFSHGPYGDQLAGSSEVPGLPAHSDPDVAEYYKRVAISRSDFAAFVESRRADPGPNGSIVAEFGDHQATAVKSIAERSYPGRDLAGDYASPLYRTFFAVHAVGRHMAYADLGQESDAAFLAARLLRATRLPTSPMFEDLARLSDACGGRFHLCSQRAELDRHLRRRIDAGMLTIQ